MTRVLEPMFRSTHSLPRKWIGIAMSRYLKNGSPGECHHCGRPFEGCAIRDRETNRYYCSDDCLESGRVAAVQVLIAMRGRKSA